ncbi:CotY/CotZ family spore coat protein [Halobacillus sp. Nhm2S1]|uniref:CotY/CotZ family spore coat protein n=1 Tax=Halobacillus sp. Nhm2S1 TaxID=2866716 RepID=UPI001C730663|nr:CotY/CotZ family spore coat protein [Halobacillus sp. Nhm2S1]MBX0359276.1 spore coat protein [Halobacillus sp. Nhm2S1]
MSCKGRDNNCVRDVIKEIIKAQDEVAALMDNGCCDVSCGRSIRDLLSPAEESPRNTTIPFILYCKDCKPFIGSGVIRKQLMSNSSTYLACLSSPVFRAKKFTNDGKCVKLELLLPESNGGARAVQSCRKKDVCDYFPGDSIRNLRATGICITVDLDCFCSITCLEPTTPLMATRHEIDDALSKYED